MNDWDALDFIQIVLAGFLTRTFGYFNKIQFYGLHNVQFKKIHAFIKDRTGHWVMAKAMLIIEQAEVLETEIKEGRYQPISPHVCIDIMLERARKLLREELQDFQSTGCSQDYFPLPTL
jgi:hypothetical protein